MRSPLGAKWLLAAVWAGLLIYAFTLAPPDDPELTRRLLQGTLRGSFAGLDPAVVAIWNLLGVIPLLYLSLLVPDGRRQRVPGWSFGLLMMAAGAFALIPWLLLRTETDSGARPSRIGMRIVRSALFRWALPAAATGLVLYGFLWGSWRELVTLFWRARLVHVMTLDLLLCMALLPYLIGKLRRPQDLRGEPAWAPALLLVPLLGPALWNALYYRPAPLAEPEAP